MFYRKYVARCPQSKCMRVPAIWFVFGGEHYISNYKVLHNRYFNNFFDVPRMSYEIDRERI